MENTIISLLFDSELKHVKGLRTILKKIVKKTGYKYSIVQRIVMTQLDTELGKVWARRRRIRNVLEKFGVNDQRSEQWLAKRGNRLTASEITKAFKSSTPAARYELMMRKLVGAKPFVSSGGVNALVWGTQFEPVAKSLYEKFEGVKIVDTSCVEHSKYAFLGASPDGIVITPDPMDFRWGKLVEFKCPISRIFKDDSPVPDYYWHQMQLQMECTGIDTCDYVEFKFTALSRSKWRESTNPHKGVFVCIDDTAEVVYKPDDEAYGDWLKNTVMQKGDDHSSVFWELTKWRKVPVPRDYTWIPTYIDELTDFWNQVLEHRKNNTVPENPIVPKNIMMLDLTDEPSIDSPAKL